MIRGSRGEEEPGGGSAAQNESIDTVPWIDYLPDGVAVFGAAHRVDDSQKSLEHVGHKTDLLDAVEPSSRDVEV